MLTQQRGIQDELAEYGWEIVEKYDSNIEWWADEVWLLKSKQHSPDHLIHVTFVVDPQWDGPRNKGQGLYTVTASLDTPQQWSDVAMSLGRGWQKELPQFLASLSNLSPKE